MELHDPGDTAVVIGAGHIDIVAARTLIPSGHGPFMADLWNARRELARMWSGADGVDVKVEDPVLHRRTPPLASGADFVSERPRPRFHRLVGAAGTPGSRLRPW